MALYALPKLPSVPKAKAATTAAISAPGSPYGPGGSGYFSINPSTLAVPPSKSNVPPSGGGFDFSTLDLTPQTPQFDASGYLASLQGDPMYQNADQAFSASVGSARQSLADQIRQMVIRGGWDLRSQMPGELSQYAGDINQATLDAAAANPMSAKAQLTQQLDQGQNALNYQLAARGMERSGGQATGNTALQNQFDTSSYGAMNQLLDSIGQGAGNFANFTSQAMQARNQAYEAAASRLAQMQMAAWYANQGGQTPGGLSMDQIAKYLPQDTNSVLGKAILGTPNFDYGALNTALKVPTYQDIINSLPSPYR